MIKFIGLIWQTVRGLALFFNKAPMTKTLPVCSNCSEKADIESPKFCESCGHSFASTSGIEKEEDFKSVLTKVQEVRNDCPYCGCDPFVVDQDGFCSDCGKRAESVKKSSNNNISCIVDEKFATCSDVGKRHHINQDAAALKRTNKGSFFAVADGVSSSVDSEIASEQAVKTWLEHVIEASEINEVNPEQAMLSGILAAQEKIVNLPYHPTPGLEEPETTLVAAIVMGKKVTVGWVGDSRAYIIDVSGMQGRLITRDDSWMSLAMDAGMSEKEASQDSRAHAITQCLGMRDQAPDVHVISLELQDHEELLLCTDGLWNYFPQANDIALSCKAYPSNALMACQDLCARSNQKGGRDNITVGLLRL